jgi:phenylpropionate dioxygenase-like ring-hydroxylating dioxygenase large terminal subunit
MKTRSIPAEGADGLFSQSWFPVCLSSAATHDYVRGFDFLDGRVIVVRDAQGAAQVLSAYCPHLGADLSIGDMIDGQVRCVFHHWRYGTDGRCTRTGIGDAAPPTARLFRFPTQERYGLVWAYNGTTPHYELPSFPYPDEELVFKIQVFGEELPVDPWVLCANTPDMQHIKHLHGIQMDGEDEERGIDWTPYSMLYSFSGVHTTGDRIQNRVGIYGTSLYYQHTDFSGKWFGFLAPFGLPRPGRTTTYMVVAVRRDLGSEAEIEQMLKFVMDLEIKVVSEDIMNMRTVHFRPGTLTRSDATLSKFFDYLRAFPRAHPAADFIK